MLTHITPVILTYNEASNIERTLARLSWAEDIVVVDSGSTDGTLELLRKHTKVRSFIRPFDSHENQWRFATEQTAIVSPWILRLDADYQIPEALVQEIAALDLEGTESAFQAAFDYAVYSRKLLASLYPPKPILLRRGRFSVRGQGHTEGWIVEGPVGTLRNRVIHDDWKAMEDSILAQVRYMKREGAHLDVTRRGLRDWLRLHPPLMPIIVFLYCYFFKGLIFNGKAGTLYTLQRTLAETILALLLIEKRLRPEADQRGLKEPG